MIILNSHWTEKAMAGVLSPDMAELTPKTSKRDPLFDANKMAQPDTSNNPTALTTPVRQAPYFHNSCVDMLKKVARYSINCDRGLTKVHRTNADGPAEACNALTLKRYGKLVRSQPFAGGYVPSNSDIADILTFLKTHQSC